MSPDTLARATNLVAHRGPDGGACWYDDRFFLGHRRLAVIDLSVRGVQPMASNDGRNVITFNGEIYNYQELRDELADLGHTFTTQTDTEVILNGFRSWGRDVLAKLRGMFAFAMCDRADGSLWLARDPFGEKPLYYAYDGRGLTFASEVAPLAAVADSRAVDVEALGEYLCLNYVPGPRTLLKGVRRVRPGEWMLVETNGHISEGSFCRIDEAEDSEGDALARLEARVDRAVSYALTSDVPVGIFLSGGVDSAVIAASATRRGQLTGAYCLTFDDLRYSEWPGASATASQLGIPLTRVQMGHSILDRFMEIVDHVDDPLADSSALAMFTVAEAAKGRHRVVLSGDGGDELFGGYLTYQATLWHQRLSRMSPLWLRRSLAQASRHLPVSEAKVSQSFKLFRFMRALDRSPWQAHLTWNGTWLPEEAAGLVTDDLRDIVSGSLRRVLARHGVQRAITLRDLQRFDLAEYLPNDILAKADRMTMAHGVEVRAPFLTPSLARFALGLPDHAKAGLFGRGKRILRRLARERYGLSAAGARKQGFSIPIHDWMRRRTPELDDLLSAEMVAKLGFLNVENVRRAIEQHTSGRRSLGWEIWGLAVLAAWFRTRVLTPPPLPPTAVRELCLPAKV